MVKKPSHVTVSLKGESVGGGGKDWEEPLIQEIMFLPYKDSSMRERLKLLREIPPPHEDAGTQGNPREKAGDQNISMLQYSR
jgi:hypothetical protein